MPSPIDERVQGVVILPNRQVEEGWSIVLTDHADVVTVVRSGSPHEAAVCVSQAVHLVERGDEVPHQRVVERSPQPRDVSLCELTHSDRLRRRDPSESLPGTLGTHGSGPA